jgi:hypothetical protein
MKDLTPLEKKAEELSHMAQEYGVILNVIMQSEGKIIFVGGNGPPTRCTCGAIWSVNPCPNCCAWWDSRCNRLYQRSVSSCSKCQMTRVKSGSCP